MWTIIAGKDYSALIPHNSSPIGQGIQFTQTTNDPAPHLTFDVFDDNAAFNFKVLDEVIVWNEAAPGEPVFGSPGVLVPAPPSHNYVQLTNVVGGAGSWSTNGPQTGLFSSFPGLSPSMTFSNTGNQYESLVIFSNPQAYYRLDESSGTTANDSSGNGNDGTISGSGVTYSMSGALGGSGDSDTAMGFNGSSGWVDGTISNLQSGSGAWSIEAWANFTSFSGTHINIIASMGTWGTNNESAFICADTSGRAQIGTFGGNHSSTTTITTGAWHHIVGTYDGANMRLYYDGNLILGPIAQTMALTGTNMAIASKPGSLGDQMAGSVDEVSFYNFALSATQVSNRYTSGTSTVGAGGNYELITARCPQGYIHAGQLYMFSAYVTIAIPLTNAQAILKIDFVDSANNTISGASVQATFFSTTGNAQQRIAIQATAPSGAWFLTASMGGQFTVANNNAGTINFGTPQVEAVWFPTRGVSYPTSDCNAAQVDCATMPDGTTSRAVRLFSGYIDTIKKEYIGPLRRWHIQCSGPGKVLDNGLINATYVNFTDAAIIQDVVTNSFSGLISTNQPNSNVSASLTTGVTISSVSYSDTTLREVMNGLSNQSNYIFYIDPYYRLWYQPQFSNSANFTLSDNPDNITSFPYYDYQLEYDGTQLKQQVKVKGGDFSGTKTDTFSGNASTTQFNLTYIPEKVTSITVTGVAKRLGTYGRDLFSSGHYDALLNTQAQYVVFNTAPPNAANNVTITYTYKAPVSTTSLINTSVVTAPPYTQPSFTTKVNDTAITDLTTATNRGLTEIIKAGTPLTIITCKSQQFAPAGSSIYFTSTSDNIINTPFVVQSVSGAMLGESEIFGVPVNEYSYTLGAYQPLLHDHLRNVNRALNRSATVANVSAAQQIDFVAMEIVGWRDTIQAH